MEVKTAQLGWCVGIERAYRLMDRQARNQDGEPLYATHHAQHPAPNADMDTLRRIEQQDTRLLEQYPALQNVRVVHDTATLTSQDTLFLGFHGLPQDTIATLTAQGVTVKDYKCPFIATLDTTVERLVADGFDILIMGKPKNHHCQYAQEVAAKAQRQCIVLEKLADIEAVPRPPQARWALVGQVTGNIVLWQTLVARAQQPDLAAHVVQTVCSDSYKRQEGAMHLAEVTDCCVIVDDAGGASQSLFEVLSARHARVHRLRWRDDGSWQAALDSRWFTGVQSVSVVGGILVPQWALDAVAAYLRDLV